MGMVSIWHMIVVVVIFLPGILVLMSNKVAGIEKASWALLAFFLSWIGLAIFLIVHAGRSAPAKHG